MIREATFSISDISMHVVMSLQQLIWHKAAKLRQRKLSRGNSSDGALDLSGGQIF